MPLQKSGPPKLRFEASVCKMNSHSKSGNFRIGSSHFISMNASSWLSSHMTNSGAQYLVSSVIGAIILAQFGIYRRLKFTIPRKLLDSFFVLGLPVFKILPTVSFCGAIESFCKMWPKNPPYQSQLCICSAIKTNLHCGPFQRTQFRHVTSSQQPATLPYQVPRYATRRASNMEWYYVWWPWLTSKRVARVCQYQLSLFTHRIVSRSAAHHKHTIEATATDVEDDVEDDDVCDRFQDVVPRSKRGSRRNRLITWIKCEQCKTYVVCALGWAAVHSPHSIATSAIRLGLMGQLNCVRSIECHFRLIGFRPK